MTRLERAFAVAICGSVLGFMLAGCESPVENSAATGENARSADIGFEVVTDEDGTQLSAKGKGRYLLSGVFDIEFSLKAKVKENGDVKGWFHQSLIFQDQLVEFHGEVTCLTVDEANGRAWIGGVVTMNNSEHPSFQEDLHQPGRDVWFRVLDNAEQNPNEPDRLTFLGFEGAAGFPTSEAYCEGMPWPDNNDRTHPVTEGNIKVDAD